jgi:phosphoglycolate phosphatase-like HAD superfamily hydrolase
MGSAYRTLGRSDAPPTAEVACWVFDVDGCLVDSLTGSSLRPGARDLLAALAARRKRVLLWSAGGDEYAAQRAAQFGVGSLVDGFYAKEGRDKSGFYCTSHLALGPGPVAFVDDHPEDLSPELTVVAVSPYLVDDPHDRGLDEVARRAGLPPTDASGPHPVRS